ncbi:hypothetical protein [Succinivibrio dextrinosolvens]|uniref:Uncharacterized protein n=1 Tax=Succinivibrio dextrinosolvens TaxID=83771 RepID=A0A662ZAA6_9GAMM|nr:hypothetical protein [Succinivibrio dextrinosolvens]SFK20439.1 hypothetical protein SAMN04487865_10378 [Succinivibrio dextrinosolvens]
MVDLTSLNTFKNVNLGNDNAIVNLNQDNKLTSNATFSKANIFRFLRSSSTQANNNLVRTELLKSLGKAFGLEQGIGAGPKGEVTFSKDFMDKLEKILGPSFKREDFGVPAEGGAVKSGKPLTQRRINQIMTQASAYETKDFSIDAYKSKLAVVMKDLGMPDVKGKTKEQLDQMFANNRTARIFADVQKSLDFLENELDELLKNNGKYEYELELTEGAEDEEAQRQKIIEGTTNKFEMKDPATGQYVNYEHSDEQKSNLRDNILWPRLGGETIHVERVFINPQTAESIKPLKNYIASTIKSFVKNSIDSYFESKRQGKIEAFNNHVVNNAGACMEDKGKKFIEFRQRHLEGPVDRALEANLNAVINGNVAKTQKEQIESEITRLVALNPEGEWEDYAAELKKTLVGKYATVIKVKVEGGRREYVEVKQDGKPVERAITAEDIDRIGEELYNDILGL